MLRQIAIAGLLLSVVAATATVSVSPVSGSPARREGAEPTMTASGEVRPGKLPRGRLAPAALRLGFTSAAAGASATPDLARIAIELSPMVGFQTDGLPSCPPTRLYGSAAGARHACAGSLVGAGSVSSEIALPGQAPAVVVGRLLAFYSEAGGRQRILAQVVTGAPLPLTYVIPFEIVDRGSAGVALEVKRMARILGQCRQNVRGCLGQPYTLEGVYSRISSLRISLRRFGAGPAASFVGAKCPAPGRRTAAVLALGTVGLSYVAGYLLSQPIFQHCVVAGA